MKYEEVTYGKFTNSEWQTINGLASVQHVLERIKQEVNWEEYELWVHGSILSDVPTWDVDLTIIGPMYPQIINNMLETIVKIGFEEKIYCDVKYSVSNQLYDPEVDTQKTILYACYQGKITISGQTYEYSRLTKDLYLKETRYPMGKCRMNDIVYKSPVRIA
jgi:NAD(P)H-flavin reductase